MPRKNRAKRDPGSDSQLGDAVRDSAQQIWLAGLGAFARAQLEGTKVFEALVKEGNALQRRALPAAEERLGEVAGLVTRAAGELSSKASESWDRLEQVFENRVARALARLGVPSTRDIQELTGLLNELNGKVAALAGEPPLARKPVKARKAASTASRNEPDGAVVRQAGAGKSGSARTGKAVKGTKPRKAAKSAKPVKPAKPAKRGQASPG